MTWPRLVAAGVLFVALWAAPADAENGPEHGTFGFQLGIDAATLAPKAPDESSSMMPGTVAGFYAVIPILKSVSFVPELIYVERFTKRTIAGRRVDARLKYVEMPLLAKMPMFWGIYMTEGVTLGFPVEEFGLAPNLSQLTSPELLITIGGGYNVAKKLAIELRYDSGLKQVSTLSTAPPQRGRVYMVLAKLHF